MPAVERRRAAAAWLPAAAMAGPTSGHAVDVVNLLPTWDGPPTAVWGDDPSLDGGRMGRCSCCCSICVAGMGLAGVELGVGRSRQLDTMGSLLAGPGSVASSALPPCPFVYCAKRC